MPSRIVRDRILTSLKVNQLSTDAELFFRRILNVVDDFGCYHGTPSLLRAAAYPLRIDSVKDKDVGKWIAQCAQAGVLIHYTAGDVPYIKVVNFGTPRAKESKFPQPYADENKCLQPYADENKCTVVVSVVEDVSVAGAGKSKAVGYSNDFEWWWSKYPAAIRDSKIKANDSWQKLSAEDRVIASKAVVAFAEIVGRAPKERRQYFKRATTWLNQRNWEAGVEAWETTAGQPQSNPYTDDYEDRLD